MKEQLEVLLAFISGKLKEAKTKAEVITLLDTVSTAGKALTAYATSQRKKLAGNDKAAMKAFIANHLN